MRAMPIHRLPAIGLGAARVLLAGGLWLLVAAGPAAATGPDDWPMWRGDAGRTAYREADLPDALRLQWVRRLPPQEPAWKDSGLMQFDRSYLPVVSGGLVFVGSTVSDRLTAYDLETGEERWRFYTGGPVRMAPAADDGRVYVASDDGSLYCLRAADGKLDWRFRGGPSDRRIIGNERIISTWPARGGPVVADGTVYFAAGVWPFMGTFVHALDAKTGRLLWTNDATSFTWRRLPHYGAAGSSGLSAQGHLVVAGDRLIVPGSRLSPAIFDRTSGRFLFYADQVTGPYVYAHGRFGFAGGRVFDCRTGCPVVIEGMGRLGRPILADDAWYTGAGVLDPASVEIHEKEVPRPHTDEQMTIMTGTVSAAGPGRKGLWLRAGPKLVVETREGVGFIPADSDDRRPEPTWEAAVEGDVSDVLAAGDRLLVVTREGAIHCFGPNETTPRTFDDTQPHGAVRSKAWEDEAAVIVKAADETDGYALVLGLKDGGLVDELLRQTKLHVVAVDADVELAGRLRRRFDDAGFYGRRAAVIAADPSAVEFAPYAAVLVTTEDADRLGASSDAGLAAKLFHSVRPYGGVACLSLPAGKHDAFARTVAEADLENAAVKRAGRWTVVRREGPLPGAADWLGQNADAGNTRCSRDRRVKAPLGVLWFGNALSNSLVLPRHGEGPVEQVAGGRLVIEGPESLSASDVYTGRLLWTRDFPGLGKYYDTTKHQRGAHAIGSNYFTVPDAVYVAAGTSCHVLDPASGRTRAEFSLPGGSEWLFLLVYEDLLIAGAEPEVRADNADGRNPRYNTPASSKRLVVMDRRSGKVLWTRQADRSFGHYAVAAGQGKVFCFDRLGPEAMERLKRRGVEPSANPSILALDARTGEVLWQTDRFVGDRLSYSEEHDVVVAAGALRGADGSVLWERPLTADYRQHANPGLDSSSNPLWWGKWGLMVRDRTIFTQGARSFDLLTGRQRTWSDAGGALHEWRFRRFHGCGPTAGAYHLLTFRSGCAAYYDLAGDGGTVNLGGFRSGCTSNLIVADGVLNAPDYTRTCSCAYQNRSSLALVHMPDVEVWGFGAPPTPGRAGFNFGAPGDRRAEAGTLWWDVPAVGGPSPDLPVTVRPEGTRYVLHHSSRIEGGDPGSPGWIAASRVEGVREVRIQLGRVGPARGRWTVRLHFTSPEGPGRRVFGVRIEGKDVLSEFDVAREAGGPYRSVVREFPGVEASGELTISLTPKRGETLLSGVEVVAETGQAKAE